MCIQTRTTHTHELTNEQHNKSNRDQHTRVVCVVGDTAVCELWVEGRCALVSLSQNDVGATDTQL